jgi:hypothetical protein
MTTISSRLSVGAKAPLHVSKKDLPIHRTIKHERRRHPAQAQTRHESDG